MARINLHSMQVLAAVALAKSLTRAATELHMTPSAISKRIAELELRFGMRIPLMADSDSIPIADSVPCDGGHAARVS